MVGDAREVDEVLEFRSERNVGSTFSKEVREFHKEDFQSEENTKMNLMVLKKISSLQIRMKTKYWKIWCNITLDN